LAGSLEQVSVRAQADKDQFLIGFTPDEQPIGLDVTFAMIRPFSC